MDRKAVIGGVLADLERSAYAMGAEWRHGHEIAQANEGDRLFDRLHALLHRIEGDEWNAGYWYRRAGTTPFPGSFAEEVEALRAALR